jgi:hypothetical protein
MFDLKIALSPQLNCCSVLDWTCSSHYVEGESVVHFRSAVIRDLSLVLSIVVFAFSITSLHRPSLIVDEI